MAIFDDAATAFARGYMSALEGARKVVKRCGTDQQTVHSTVVNST